MLIQKLSVKHSTSALLMVQEVSPSTVSSVPMELCSISNILCVTGGSMWTVQLRNLCMASMMRLLLNNKPTLQLEDRDSTVEARQQVRERTIMEDAHQEVAEVLREVAELSNSLLDQEELPLLQEDLTLLPQTTTAALVPTLLQSTPSLRRLASDQLTLVMVPHHPHPHHHPMLLQQTLVTVLPQQELLSTQGMVHLLQEGELVEGDTTDPTSLLHTNLSFTNQTDHSPALA